MTESDQLSYHFAYEFKYENHVHSHMAKSHELIVLPMCVCFYLVKASIVNDWSAHWAEYMFPTNWQALGAEYLFRIHCLPKRVCTRPAPATTCADLVVPAFGGVGAKGPRERARGCHA